jgi:ribose 5-phosphate isomerase A
MVTLTDVDDLDLAVDGADEVAPDGSLVKGAGGAMLRERVVAREARRFIVLVTPEKIVPHLGARFALPVEVVQFALPTSQRHLTRLAGRATLRRTAAGGVYATDNGNPVLDVDTSELGASFDPRALDVAIRAIPGVVDTGYFFDMTSLVLVGSAEGVREIVPPTK